MSGICSDVLFHFDVSSLCLLFLIWLKLKIVLISEEPCWGFSFLSLQFLHWSLWIPYFCLYLVFSFLLYFLEFLMVKAEVIDFLLGTASVASHMLIYCVFIFIQFKIPLWLSFLIHGLFASELFSFQIFGDFLEIFVLGGDFIPKYGYALCNLNPLKCIKTCLLASSTVCVHIKNVYSAVVLEFYKAH